MRILLTTWKFPLKIPINKILMNKGLMKKIIMKKIKYRICLVFLFLMSPKRVSHMILTKYLTHITQITCITHTVKLTFKANKKLVKYFFIIFVSIYKNGN